MVICLERGADLHMVQLMPLPLNISCFSKIQIGFTFLVPAYPGSPGQRAINVTTSCMCMYVRMQFGIPSLSDIAERRRQTFMNNLIDLHHFWPVLSSTVWM